LAVLQSFDFAFASPWVEKPIQPPASQGPGGFFRPSVFSNFYKIFWGCLKIKQGGGLLGVMCV
jgi:hypothetical protein